MRWYTRGWMVGDRWRWEVFDYDSESEYADSVLRDRSVLKIVVGRVTLANPVKHDGRVEKRSRSWSVGADEDSYESYLDMKVDENSVPASCDSYCWYICHDGARGGFWKKN